MNGFLASALLLAVSVAPVCATEQKEQSTDEMKVKAAVARLGAGVTAQVKIRLRSRVRIRGFIERIGESDFVVIDFEAQGSGIPQRIAYADVTQITGRGVSLTLSPTPRPAPFGSWDVVMKLPPDRRLAVTTINRKSVKGKLTSATETTITLMTDKHTTDFKREDVLNVYWLTDKSASMKDETVQGTGDGLRLSGALVPCGDPTIGGRAIGAGIGAGVGAIKGALKSRQKRVLIYAQ